MSYFEQPKTLEELKNQYKRLIKTHHPDVGGSNEAMKEINNEYEKLFRQIERNFTPEEKKSNKHTVDDGFREVIEKIINLPEIKIEIIGCWLWVSGNTYPVRGQLNLAGLIFSGSKKMWHWHKPEDTKKHYRGKTSISQIRSKYGSFEVEKETRKSLKRA